jgi:uncharacterized membrane protein
VGRESALERAVFRWLAIVLALASGMLLLWVYWLQGTTQLLQLGGLALGSVLAAGKLVIFAGLGPHAPSIWTIAFTVFAIDMFCALAMAAGLRPLEEAPRIGSWLRSARSRATEVLRDYPGFRRLAFFGVVAFVLSPIAGTGAITGSFVARLVGLSRLGGVAAIGLASGWSTAVFALLAQFLGRRAETVLEDPLLIAAVLVVGMLLCWLAYQHVLRRLKG